MRTERSVIQVKDGSPETITLKFTQHGPLLWEAASHNRALALRWVGAEPGTAGYLASLSLDRAQNWNEFLAALERWKLPPENMVYADTEGNIGEQSAGLTPIRTWTGLLPIMGVDGGHEWSGFVPLEQLPRTFNPVEGWFATANNRTFAENYKYKVGYEWATYRVERIRQACPNLRRGNARYACRMSKNCSAMSIRCPPINSSACCLGIATVLSVAFSRS